MGGASGGALMAIIRKYMADFPKWYIQAELNGVRVELNYDHEPTDEEVDAKMVEITKVPDEPVATIELVGENGQII